MQIYHFALRLSEISVVLFDEFDAYFVALTASSAVRRVLLYVISEVFHLKLIAAASATVAKHLFNSQFEIGNRLRAVRSAAPTDDDVTS
jgi:hypothetical protein